MDQVTAEQIQQEVNARGIVRWSYRKCSICRAPLYYEFYQTHVDLDTNCNCVDDWVEPKEVGFEGVAALLNMQSPQIRQEMWTDMLREKQQ